MFTSMKPKALITKQNKTKQKPTTEKGGGTNVREIKVTYVTKRSNPALD